MTFLDVGQGDAILIQTPSGKEMLIDGGPTHKIVNQLGNHVSHFDRTLDVVLGTHPDADHVTGLIPIFNRYDVGRIITSNVKGTTGVFEILSETIENENAPTHVARTGDVIDFGDGVVAHILYPNDRVAKETNEGSVSLLITYGKHSYLLTGDLSSTYEDNLLQDILPRHVTVYKAGHHGSRTSSGVPLLSYIKPEYAVISAGKNNSYGHPHQEVIDRLLVYAKETLSTIDRGAITFISDGHLLTVETDR